MFDIGFSEMMTVALVALIVLGPEKLPAVARQAGQWMGKLQRYVADVKTDINRQMELDELRKMQTELQDTARSLEAEVGDTVSQLRGQLEAISTDPSAAASTSGSAAPAEPAATDWDKVYAVRRTRERIKERRRSRADELRQIRRLR